MKVNSEKILMGVGIVAFFLLILTGKVEAATLTWGDIAATGQGVNLCSIIKTIQDWLIVMIPATALFMIAVSVAFWFASGSKEDFLTLSKNITIKTLIGLAFVLIFYFIVDMLGYLVAYSNAKDIILSGGHVDNTGKIVEICSFDIWKKATGLKAGGPEFDAATFLSATVGNNLFGMMVDLKNFGVAMIGLIATIFMLWGGVQYISATGPEGATKGRNTIMYASGGVLVAWMANFIIQTLLSFL